MKKDELVDTQLKIRLMMLAFWLFMVGRFFKPFLLAIKSKSWPTTLATVASSSLDGGDANYGHNGPKVIYRFNHNGREYVSDNVTYLGIVGTSKLNAVVVVQRCPEGSQVAVRFDPANPDNSVIIPGVHWAHYVSFAVLTAFCLAVAFVIQILNFIWPGCQPNCT